MGDPLDFVDEGGWPYPDEDAGTRTPEPVDLRSDADDDLVALHALTPRALGPLSDDERAVVAARFGLDGHDPMTMDQLGPALGMSRARCRAALSSGLGKLRTLLGDDQA
ncbi:MAG TPA: sigma factor-like helix-turn-helix DNA-binding protein [Acidimicrobiales bacterium]|jgi:DNA-directed RNA polymerase sigma subunit (sigma70/sigma32)